MKISDAKAKTAIGFPIRFPLDYVRIYKVREVSSANSGFGSLSENSTSLVRLLERNAGHIRADYDLQAVDAIFNGDMQTAISTTREALTLERSLGCPLYDAEIELDVISTKVITECIKALD